ncbi:MAG: HDIG domain-containing protein [Candidatus Bathyarchaeota archaeon]|jgi:putative nucleotidyltransferase with HDIG domain|nr:HDIG domain-containing protein [Candidatus Bathyarchaeota archaeon]
MISKSEALRLVKGTSKYSHALMVSCMMKTLAKALNENEEEWMLVGLLHDLDYDRVKNDMKMHGVVAAEMLKGKLPEKCLYAVKAHDYRSRFKPESKLDKALIATDSLASLIEKIGMDVEKLNVAKLRVELENISAVSPWYKSNIMKCEEIGLKMDEFLRLCLNSIKKEKCR